MLFLLFSIFLFKGIQLSLVILLLTMKKLLAREYMLKFAVFYDTVLVIFLVGFFVGKRSKRSDRHVV
uniref:Uncharacterized protein n=1 Tax=Bird gammacoronavirus AnasCN24 TaxID=3237959 RepID=A0AB39ADS6_9GAMC